MENMNIASATQDFTAGAGYVYIIYNFPHTITVNNVINYTNTSSVSITGSISATNSTTAVSGVQYQLDGNSPPAAGVRAPDLNIFVQCEWFE